MFCWFHFHFAIISSHFTSFCAHPFSDHITITLLFQDCNSFTFANNFITCFYSTNRIFLSFFLRSIIIYQFSYLRFFRFPFLPVQFFALFFFVFRCSPASLPKDLKRAIYGDFFTFLVSTKFMKNVSTAGSMVRPKREDDDDKKRANLPNGKKRKLFWARFEIWRYE